MAEFLDIIASKSMALLKLKFKVKSGAK